jgi:topoisomerase-4 subunit A
VLTLPAAARVLPPAQLLSAGTDRVATITSAGHPLVVPLSELPELPRGKDNKIINIPGAKAAACTEWVAAIAILHAGASMTIHSGRRHFTLKPSDLALYEGERGRRGKMLPRGFQHVDAVEVA